jgi:hypothetical protein
MNQKNMSFSDFGTIIEINPGYKRFEIRCEKKIITVYAHEDCCSESWFEYPPHIKETMQGHYVKSIIKGDAIEMPPSGIQGYDENHEVIITFTDDQSCKFILRNSSNGYYHGWISIGCIDTPESPIPPDTPQIYQPPNTIQISQLHDTPQIAQPPATSQSPKTPISSPPETPQSPKTPISSPPDTLQSSKTPISSPPDTPQSSKTPISSPHDTSQSS